MSATIGKLFYGLLMANSDVTGKVGTRVYPNTAPLNVAQTFPYLVYKVIGTEPTNTKGHLADWTPEVDGPTDRRSPLDIVDVQVSIFAVNYNDAADLAQNCREALDRAIGSGFTHNTITVDSLIYDAESNMYEKDIKPAGVYHVAQTYVVRTINTWNAPAFANNYSIFFQDGGQPYLDCGDSNLFSFGDGSSDTPFSFSCWIRPDTIGNTRILMGKHSGTGDEEYELRFGSGGGGNGLRFRLYDLDGGSYIQVRLDVNITASVWTHIVATYDGTGTAAGIQIYENAVVPAGTELSQAGYVAMHNSASPLTLGTLGSQGGTTYFNGYMDEVSIWGKELSAAEVLSMYNTGTPTDLTGSSNLNGWWRMGDAGAYPTINDSSTNSNTATMENMVAGDIQNVVP